MPLPLSIDHPQAAVLRTRQGIYATIAVRGDDGVWREAPVALAAVQAVADWRHVAEAQIDALAPADATLAVQATATGFGTFSELPVVDLFISADRTLAEHLVAQGVAVPQAELIDRHVRRDALIAALAEARRAGRGCWGEAGADPVALGVGGELALATAPPAAAPMWFGHAAWLFLIALVLLMAWREAHWRRVAGSADRPRRLRRFGELFVGVSSGFGKPLPPIAGEDR
ncbi:MAG TPA: hypothetical protein VEL07_22340 [Planctomycetota bacterium]|nr:hypothetical protein [Planctomycetota bacterium]